MTISYRHLTRQDLALFHQLDRTERIDYIYVLHDMELLREDHFFDVPDWSPDDKADRIAELQADLDRGATAFGAFAGDRLVGMALVDHNFLPTGDRRLNLIGLWVSHGYRNRGVGRSLMELAAECARAHGAKALYISATPSENTIRFYRALGCRFTDIIDPDLFAAEPQDIHLELPLFRIEHG